MRNRAVCWADALKIDRTILNCLVYRSKCKPSDTLLKGQDKKSFSISFLFVVAALASATRIFFFVSLIVGVTEKCTRHALFIVLRFVDALVQNDEFELFC